MKKIFTPLMLCLVSIVFTAKAQNSSNISFTPQHNVLIEEATGDWCGWCIRGIVYLDSLQKTYPNTVDIVSVHGPYGYEPMSNNVYDYGEEHFPGMNGNFPNMVVDRTVVADPGYAFTEYNAHIGDNGYADLTVSPSFNSSTRVLTVTVSGHFASALSGDYRFAVAITEDSVHGTNTAYDQENYYSGGGAGKMGGFEKLTNPISWSEMYYSFVARTILGNYGGQNGSLPSTIPINSTQSYTFTYTVPTSYNVAHMKAIGMLLEQSSYKVLNSNSSPLVATGFNELNSGVTDAVTYPNPFNNNVNLTVSLSKAEHVNVIISDILGRTVSNTDEGNLAAGSHDFTYGTSTLSPGMYVVTIKTADGEISRKVIKD